MHGRSRIKIPWILTDSSEKSEFMQVTQATGRIGGLPESLSEKSIGFVCQ